MQLEDLVPPIPCRLRFEGRGGVAGFAKGNAERSPADAIAVPEATSGASGMPGWVWIAGAAALLAVLAYLASG